MQPSQILRGGQLSNNQIVTKQASPLAKSFKNKNPHSEQYSSQCNGNSGAVAPMVSRRATTTTTLPTFSSAKPIVHCPLSIVHYPLSIVTALLILLCLLFAGSLSAQDNYSVIVKCYPASNSSSGTFYYTSYYTSFYSYKSTKRGAGSSAITTYTSTKLATTYSTAIGNILASYSSSSTLSTDSDYDWTVLLVYNAFTTSSTMISYSSTSYARGWVNFSIANIPTFTSISSAATLNFWQTSNVAHGETIYNPTVTPAGTASGYYNSLTSNSLRSFSSAAQTTAYQTVTINANRLKSLRSIAGSTSVSTYMLAFAPSLNTSYKLNVAGANAATSKQPYLAVQYSAPWSKVLSPSAKVPATSACATGGTYTLTASQAQNTSYVSVVPKTWTWYSATASGAGYAYIGTTTASTYTVSGLNDPGTIWYRYAENASMVSNTARSTLSSYYTIGTNLCSPAKIEFKCTPLPSNPTFSATDTGDRSVTLTWSGISGTDHYLIRYGVDGGISFKEITVPYGTDTVTIENLTNGREYYFQIQAIGGIEASGCQYCTTQLSTKAHVTPDCDE